MSEATDTEPVLEIPLTVEQRREIRERARKAATDLEREASETLQALGKKMPTPARLALARSIDQAMSLRAMADALERKS